MGAVHGLLLGLRIPPGVQKENVVGLGEGQAEAPGFKGDEEDVGPPIPEGLNDGLPVGRRAVEVDGAHAGGVEFGAHTAEVAGELAEHEGFMPLGDNGPQLPHEHLDLGAASAPARGAAGARGSPGSHSAGMVVVTGVSVVGYERRVQGHEPQGGQGLERTETGLGGVFLQQAQDLLAFPGQALVVGAPMGGGEFDGEDLLGLLGEFGGHLLLGAAQ